MSEIDEILSQVPMNDQWPPPSASTGKSGPGGQATQSPLLGGMQANAADPTGPRR